MSIFYFCLFFTCSIGNYDKNLYEEGTVNRLKESFRVFDQLNKSGFFLETKMIVIFLNQYKEFLLKIKKTPITVALKDFPKNLNPNDPKIVLQHIFKKFEPIYKFIQKS